MNCSGTLLLLPLKGKFLPSEETRRHSSENPLSRMGEGEGEGDKER